MTDIKMLFIEEASPSVVIPMVLDFVESGNVGRRVEGFDYAAARAATPGLDFSAAMAGDRGNGRGRRGGGRGGRSQSSRFDPSPGPCWLSCRAPTMSRIRAKPGVLSIEDHTDEDSWLHYRKCI